MPDLDVKAQFSPLQTAQNRLVFEISKTVFVPRGTPTIFVYCCRYCLKLVPDAMFLGVQKYTTK